MVVVWIILELMLFWTQTIFASKAGASLIMPTYSLLVFLISSALTAATTAQDLQTQRDQTIQPIDLPAIDGSRLQISKQTDSELTVICFLGTECPLAKLYSVKLERMHNELGAKGVRIVGVSSNIQDSIAEMLEFASAHNVSFPIAKDFDNAVADQLGAKRTPEVFIVDQNLSIKYRGRIDDQFLPGISRHKPSRNDLRIAISELLSGQRVSVPNTEVEGCLIGRVKKTNESDQDDPTVTYTNQIARVFQKHCIECHRTGEIGPFSLTNYDEAMGWAEMIVEVVDQRRMPPWHATASHARLANQRIMPESDKRLLRDWLAAGTPHGDPKHMPTSRKFVNGWRLPKNPDVVIEMSQRPFVVPPDGTVEYQYFVVDPGWKEDRWVAAAEVIPGNRRVVHHSIVFVRPPDGSEFRGSGWIGAYVPGQRHVNFPAGHARLIPAGSKLIFQQHYTPVGSKQTDVTRLGLVFIPEGEVTHEILTLIGIDQKFEIPPHAADHRVELRLPWLPKEARVLAVAPHMHWRGKSFNLFSISGKQRTQLIEVPQYDFNWQHNYRFAEPIATSEIDSLEFDVTFDNSRNNPMNPDPAQYVTWGDQTWQEMAVAFFEVARPIANQQIGGQQASEVNKQGVDVAEEGIQSKANKLTDEFFNRFDKNGDGVISQNEPPRSVGRFGFWQFDTNGDNQLSRDEVRSYAISDLKSRR